MITNELETAKTKIEQQKQKILLKEKILKAKEKRMQIKRSVEVGKIACKAMIDQIDPEILLGAFLDISDQKNDNAQLANWKKKAENFLKKKALDPSSQLIISFHTEIKPEIKALLKNMDFKWNHFRKEFYGYGCRKTLEQALAGSDFKIEILD